MPFMLLAQIKKDSIKVFYLGGQSNMEGFGYVKNLPDSLKKKNKGFFIWLPVGDYVKIRANFYQIDKVKIIVDGMDAKLWKTYKGRDRPGCPSL